MGGIEWPLVISITALITALYCLYTLLSIRYRKKNDAVSSMIRDDVVRLSQRIDQMHSKLSTLSLDPARLETMTGQLSILEERIDGLELRGSGGASYKMASRLAKRGISVRELAKTCGMTKGEADLLDFMRKA